MWIAILMIMLFWSVAGYFVYGHHVFYKESKWLDNTWFYCLFVGACGPIIWYTAAHFCITDAYIVHRNQRTTLLPKDSTQAKQIHEHKID